MPGLPKEDRNVFRAHRGDALGQLPIPRLADTSHYSQNQMLTVCLQQEGVLLLPKCRLDEYVAQFRLQFRVQVNLRLFNRHNLPPVRIGMDESCGAGRGDHRRETYR